MQDEFDVAIVGGGPVGLWLACELRLAGCSVLVLERRTQRIAQSRALTIHGRTLETFALRGLADRFLARGKPLPSGHYALLDTRLDFTVLESRFPHSLFIPQVITEGLLEDRAIELGVDVRRGHTASAIRQDAGRVEIDGDGADGPFHVTARYGIGADGARSIVRAEAGIDFPGMGGSRTLAMGDVRLELPEGPPMVSRMNERGNILIAPLGDNVHHRIVLLDRTRPHVPPETPLSLDELAASARLILGEDYQPRDPLWLTRFTDESGLATRYRKDRIFLAGDAAHIHIPAGGQGMNVGIQDAMNLGWKLAAVLKDQAPAALLDTFEHERRPIGQRLFDNTLAQGALASAFEPAGLALRAEISRFLQVPELNRMVAGAMSGFSIAYPDPLLGDDPADADIGQRVPDEDLFLPDGATTTIFDHLTAGRWLHLSLRDGAEAPLPAWLAREAVTFVAARRGKESGELKGRAAVLIRPDGYIAASVPVKGRTARAG